MSQNYPIRSPYQPPATIPLEERSPRNRLLAFTLAVFFGYLGVHRFYTGRFWTGIAMFLTGGGFGIWWVIDVLILLAGRFKDGEGRVLGPPMHRAIEGHQQHQRHQPQPHLQQRLGHDGSTARSEEDIALDSLLEDPLEEEFRKLAEQRSER